MNESMVLDTLREVMDPELGANVVDLGLIQEVGFHDRGFRVRLGTTSPACPMSEYLGNAARSILRNAFPDVRQIEVEVAWDPEWSPEKMSPELKLQYGWE